MSAPDAYTIADIQALRQERDDWERVAAIAMNDVLTLRLRILAAEKLLHEADVVIEILKGDTDHEIANGMLDDIERYWQTYPEPLE